MFEGVAYHLQRLHDALAGQPQPVGLGQIPPAQVEEDHPQACPDDPAQETTDDVTPAFLAEHHPEEEQLIHPILAAQAQVNAAQTESEDKPDDSQTEDPPPQAQMQPQATGGPGQGTP